MKNIIFERRPAECGFYPNPKKFLNSVKVQFSVKYFFGQHVIIRINNGNNSIELKIQLIHNR